MQSINKINPVVIFIYFVCVIGLGMMITHPFYLLASLLISTGTIFLVNRKKAIKTMGLYFIAAIGICAVNPLLNSSGETVLFSYFGGRAYTLEALCYGFVMAMLFITVANWFSCYSGIISSDKFMYIFGKVIPSTSLLLSMVLRFVPVYSDKLSSISVARQSVGKGLAVDTYKGKAENGMTLVSALTSSVLEDSVLTANAMRSRGYGLSGRTSFSVYRFNLRDLLILITELILFTAIICISFFYGEETSFFPILELPQMNINFYLGIISYILLMCFPSIIILTEEIQWKHLKSKI